MNPTDTITTLFQHHLWSNLVLFERCSQLNSEQLDASISGSYGTIYVTMQHIVHAEKSYFSRVSTGQPLIRPENEPPMTMAEMLESLRRTGEGFIEWAPKIQATDTALYNWYGTPRDVPKTIILTQALNHATEHREQIKAIMTDIGIEPPDLQSWAYFDYLYNNP